MEQKYYAFISYSRQNAEAASFLHKQLEHFRIPAKYVDKKYMPGGEKYLRPIFRDKRDLEVNANNFSEDIRNAVASSRYLVVLCSPEAAESIWVNEEIKYFLETHENCYEQVVPVILTGKPGHAGNQECLPPALRVDEIICRNLPSMIPDEGDSAKYGWENGVAQVLSYMLHVPREKIKASIDAEKVRLARLSAAIGSAVTLVFLCLTFWAIRAERIANIHKQDALEKEKLALANEARAKASEQRAIESKHRADRNARDVREQMERVRKVLVYLQKIFQQANPEQGGQKDIELVDALMRTLPRIREEESSHLEADLNLHTGTFLYNTTRYEKAGQQLHSAHRYYMAHAPDSENCALAKEMLARLYSANEKFTKAKKYAEEALQIWKNLHGEDNDHFDRLSLLLSEIQFRLAQPDAALKLAERALQNQLRRNKNELTESVADCYHALSNACYSLKQREKEFSYLEQALKIRLNLLGEKHVKTAKIYNNIGVYYQEKKEYRKALENFQKALNITQSLLGENDPSVSKCNMNVGLICLLLNRLEEADRYFEKAIRIKEDLFRYDPATPAVAEIYFAIGTFCLDQKHSARARQYLQRALELNQEIDGGTARIDTARNHYMLALSCEALQDYTGAVGNYKAALQIVEKLKRPDMEEDRALIQERLHGLEKKTQKTPEEKSRK